MTTQTKYARTDIAIGLFMIALAFVMAAVRELMR